MLRIVIPHVEPVRYRFAVQYPGELDVGIQTNIPISRAEDNLHLTVAAEKPIVRHIRDKVWRIIEVAVVIVIAVEKLVNVECAAHAYAVRDHVWMLHGEIHTMVAAEAASGDSQLPSLVLPAYEGKKFVQDIAFILQMP